MLGASCRMAWVLAWWCCEECGWPMDGRKESKWCGWHRDLVVVAGVWAVVSTHTHATAPSYSLIGSCICGVMYGGWGDWMAWRGLG